MTILVTGGTGYIGSHTVVELLTRGYDVVIIDNLSNSQLEVLSRIDKITGREPEFVQGDVTCRTDLRQIFEHYDIEAVIHFAALKSVNESIQQPLTYYDNNIGGTIALLDVMNEYNVNKFVYSSSATVYGANNPSPLRESMPIGEATNPYGYSKIVSEKMIQDVALAQPDLSAVILRYFNPIGAHESGLIGEAPDGIPANIMPYITQVATGKLDYVEVFGNDYDTCDGTGVRDYIHVVDLAIAHVAALDMTVQEQGVHIYNLGTGQGYSVLELIHTFEQVSGQAIPLQVVARREGDLAEAYADPSLANKELDWYAERDLQQMCQDSWRWQSNNPSGY